MESKAKAFLKISVLQWADLLVAYPFYVMQDYLTDSWNLSFTHAAAILNIWSGISMVLPFFVLFVVETKLGHFTMLVLSSIAYTAGIGLITMSTPPALANLTATCKQYKSECIGYKQKVIFYVGMALLAVGMAGQSVSIKPLLIQQGISPSDRGFSIKSLIRAVIIPIVAGILFANIKSWSLLFGIPAICSLVAVILFLSGWNTYTKDKPEACAFTTVCRVFVAAARKKPHSTPERFYKKDDKETFTTTRCLGCLEKAAKILPGDELGADGEPMNRWKLCSVAEVEEAKIAVRMVPMWLTFIVFGIVSSIGNTYFIEQASNMDRHLGTWNVPLPVLVLIFKYFKFFSEVEYRFVFVLENEDVGVDLPDVQPLLLRLKRASNEMLNKAQKGFVDKHGISMGMIYSIACCIVAAVIEKKRLKVIVTRDLLEKPDEVIPMSAFWLLFQFFLLAIQDAFFENGVAKFFEAQAPESMRNYLDQLSRGVRGLGYMFGVVSVYVCGRVSQIGGRKNWFQFTLNESRLDRYYWFLAALSSVNVLAFILVSKMYTYKSAHNAQTSHGTGDVV